MHLSQCRETPPHESGGREQHQRECHLPDDECTAHGTLPHTSGHPAPAIAQGADIEVASQQGNEAQYDPDDQCDTERDECCLRCERDGTEARHVGGCDAQQQLQGRPRHRDGREAGRAAEQQRLGEMMCGEVHAVRAECGAHRDLAPPRFHAHEEQIADVRRGDHEHQKHRAEQHPQGARHLGAEYRVAQRCDAHTESIVGDEPLGVGRGHLLRESGEQRRELHLCGLGGHAGLEAADTDVRMIVVERSRRVDARRHPEVRTEAGEVGRISEGARHRQRDARRRHPDDRERAEHRLEVPSHDTGIAAESALMVLVAQHHRLRRSGRIVLSIEQATVHRTRTEHVEHGVGGVRHTGELGVAAAGHGEAVRAIDAERLQCARIASEVDVATRRHAPVAFAATWHHRGVEHRDEPLGIRVWQRAQHDGVEDRIHRGGRSDAERERAERDHRERPLPCERTHRVPRLACECAPELRAGGLS